MPKVETFEKDCQEGLISITYAPAVKEILDNDSAEFPDQSKFYSFSQVAKRHGINRKKLSKLG